MPVRPTRARAAFTLTEILIVIGVLVLLVSLLLPALASVRSQGQMTTSMSNMRQIGVAMGGYAGEHREQVLPSQFNYRDNAYPGKIRIGSRYADWESRGTWADILWTSLGLGTAKSDDGTIDYRTDSPDRAFYESQPDFQNPLRSAASNSRNVVGGDLATPYGQGALEQGLPGYFAANDFFNNDKDSATFNDAGPFAAGQIRAPDRSMYLVDSFAGEIIATESGLASDPFDNSTGSQSREVDFRYNDACLMLMLDGHVVTQTEWEDREALLASRAVRLTRLTERSE